MAELNKLLINYFCQKKITVLQWKLQQILIFSIFGCFRLDGLVWTKHVWTRNQFRIGPITDEYWHYWVYSSFTGKIQHSWLKKFKFWKFSLTPEVVFLLNCPDAGNYPDPNGKDNQKQIDKWRIKLHWQGKLLSRLAQVPSNKIANLHISVLDENNPFRIYIKVPGRNAYLVSHFFIFNHESNDISSNITVKFVFSL